MTTADLVASCVTWGLIGVYASTLVIQQRKLRRLSHLVALALDELANPTTLRKQAWALIAENDRLRSELASKEHHMAAMQARINGLEGDGAS